jgi:hypothetical protein
VRLRASWVSQGPFGWAVTPRMWTSPWACSTANEHVQPGQADCFPGGTGRRRGSRELGL